MRKQVRRKRAAGLRWALATVAPWALSAGVLVSFTASAGQNHEALPYSALLRTAPAVASSFDEGPSMLVAASAFRLPGVDLQSSFRQAHLSHEAPERRYVVDPRRPREDMKKSISGFPEVDRSAKGDLLPGLRPTLTRGAPAGELERVVFGDKQPTLISAGFVPEGEDVPAGPQIGFEPFANPQGVTDPALSDASPRNPLQPRISSAREALLHLESIDGSTPFAKPAHVAASATPAGPASSTTPRPFQPEPPPQLVARAPALPPVRVPTPATGPRQNYAGLIASAAMAGELRCLAQAIYFEARSESEDGRAAVAQVVLNRVQSGLYPNTVCGVVFQNAHRHLACQFTFACEGKSLRITEPQPWQAAVRIARDVYEGKTYLTDVGASTHYHADYVRPYWARRLKKMDTIGRHVFYKLRPGQT